MTTSPTTRLQDIAAEWREARRIYPVYAALISRFDLKIATCRLLDSPIDRAEEEATAAVREWLEKVDLAIEAAQLRHILQTTSVGTEGAISSLVRRYLAKPDAEEAYRDRIEFLLSQYFSHSSAASFSGATLKFDQVAHALEPVLGPVGTQSPVWLKELDELLGRLEKFRSLRDFLTGGALEQGRVLKSRYSNEFVKPAVLTAITRYNFLVRVNFIRLLHNDLDRIQKCTHELLVRGIKEIDCSAAGLSKTASPEEVLRFAANWKAIFRKDYSERQVATAVVRVLDSCEQKLRSVPENRVSEPVVATPIPVAAATTGAAVAMAPVRDPAMIEAAEQQLMKQSPAPIERPRYAMYQVQESIAGQLAKMSLGKAANATVMLGDCKVVLSSWEVVAFAKPENELAEALQQAAVARAIVAEAVARKKSNDAPDLKAVIGLGRAEIARLQEGIAQARDARNMDAAVNLAASQKRLMQILDEAEKA